MSINYHLLILNLIHINHLFKSIIYNFKKQNIDLWHDFWEKNFYLWYIWNLILKIWYIWFSLLPIQYKWGMLYSTSPRITPNLSFNLFFPNDNSHFAVATTSTTATHWQGEGDGGQSVINGGGRLKWWKVGLGVGDLL